MKRVVVVALCLLTIGPGALHAKSRKATAASRYPISGAWRSVDAIAWPKDTEVLPCENREGVLLLIATLRGRTGADSTGPFVLDTGAGFLGLDLELARAFGVADSDSVADPVGLARRPLPSFRLGGLSMDDVDPILTIDGEVVRRVTDLPVLGLLGQLPLSERAVWIDYRAERVALIPIARASEDEIEERKRAQNDAAAVERSHAALAATLSNNVSAIPFRLAGDGKALVRVRVSNPKAPRYSPWMTLILDTGASKTVLFEPDLEIHAPRATAWPTLRGLSAPTLVGDASAMLARVPTLELKTDAAVLRAPGVDAAVLRSELSGMLSRVVGEPVAGLLGYSFLKRYRAVIDYPNRVLWLDPIPDYTDDRPLEYSHVGLQLERREGRVVVSGVAEDSPADRAGIVAGDVLERIDGDPAEQLDIIELTKRMEGPAGSVIQLTVRRGESEHAYRLRRRRLL